MASKIHGIAFVRVNGTLLRAEKGASLKVGGYKRETKTGHSVYGYTEEVEASAVEAKVFHMADTDLVAMSAHDNVVIDFESDDGDAYVVPEAWLTESTKLDGDGTVALKYEGKPAIRKG